MTKTLFLKFEETSAGRCAASLLADHSVKPEHIFAKVYADVNFAIPVLVDGGKYTTAMLCEPEAWAAWLTAERRVAGMCLAFLERKKHVNLRLHKTRSGKGKKRYCTLPTHVSRTIKPTIINDSGVHGSGNQIL